MKLKPGFKLVGIGALALVLTGCLVSSLHPFYSDRDVIFDPGLVGEWAKDADSTERWVFERVGEGDSYRLTYTEGAKSSVVLAHLFKLQGQMFLDLLANPTADESPFPTIPSHSLMRVDQIGPVLRMKELDLEWLSRLLEEEPKALQHTFVSEGQDQRLVVTAETQELQQFVLRHLEVEKAWGEGVELRRMSAKRRLEATPPAAAEPIASLPGSEGPARCSVGNLLAASGLLLDAASPVQPSARVPEPSLQSSDPSPL
jgi:hypothetical protein